MALQQVARGVPDEASMTIDDAALPKDPIVLPTRTRRKVNGWRLLLLLRVLRLDDVLTLIDYSMKIAQALGNLAQARVLTVLRSRGLFDVGRLGDAQAEAEAALEMMRINGVDDRAAGIIEGWAIYVLGRVALHTGLAADLAQARRRGVCSTHRSSQANAWAAGSVPGSTTRSTSPALTARTSPWPISTHWPPTSSRSVIHAAPLTCRPRSDSCCAPDGRATPRPWHTTWKPPPNAVPASPTYARPPSTPAPCWINGLTLPKRPSSCTKTTRARSYVPRRWRTRACSRAPPTRWPPSLAVPGPLLYLDVGAHRDAARVRKQLRVHGVRRPAARRPCSAWPELTTSETAVLRLVVDGATNREVAKALFISPHTVNAHLRHIFSKLGINSRIELVRLAAQREPISS